MGDGSRPEVFRDRCRRTPMNISESLTRMEQLPVTLRKFQPRIAEATVLLLWGLTIGFCLPLLAALLSIISLVGREVIVGPV